MSYPGIFHDAPYLPHSDNKLGRYFNLAVGELQFRRAIVPKDLRDSRVLRDTKDSARNNDK